MSRLKKAHLALGAVGLTGALMTGSLVNASASSHREAPLITEDPVADLTDLYAFVSPDNPDTVTLIANVIPFEKPAGGPNFSKFGDDVLYEFHIDADGDAVADKDLQFRFSTTTANPATFLYNTNQVTSLNDPDLNVKQTYSVVLQEHKNKGEDDDGLRRKATLGSGLLTAPANVGVRSTPNYEANLGSQAVHTLSGGIKVFAGPRDDPFFVDLGSIFDLGGLRPLNPAHLIPLPAAPGEDYVADNNVHTIAIQIPKAMLADKGDPVIGVWATTSRRKVRVLNGKGVLNHSGDWVQVSRLGHPLVNEVVIPLGMKDRFNASSPAQDAQFAANVLDPELARLIPVLYPGVTVPTNVDLGLGLPGRQDLATIFLTGIPGVNKPIHVTPSEMLRLNTSTPSGFPNGRLLADDVTDVSLRAMAGGTAFTPAFNHSPNNILTDGVDANDRPFLTSFPYVAPPISGTD